MEPSIDTDIENEKIYGNCRVWTQIDIFTDEESHHLKCGEGTSTDFTAIGIHQFKSGELILGLSTGIMSHMEDTIPITLRIDKGKVIERNARWDSNSGFAVILDNRLALFVMDELANGKKLAIQVGNERGEITLNDEEKAAVQDFKQRIKMPIIENEKIYGNCRVVTEMHAFTDAKRHQLVCGEKISTDFTAIGIHQFKSGELTLFLGKSDTSYEEGDKIPIKFRIDRGEVIERDVSGYGHPYGAFISDTELALDVMDELANGKKVAIQVGEERGSIILDGAKAAIQDFKRRMK